MKKLIIFVFAITIGSRILGQTISNNGFEITLEKSKKIPDSWNLSISKPNGEQTTVLTDQFRGYTDNKVYHSGKHSLKLLVTDSTSFVFGATQRIHVNISSPKSIRISAWIKTSDCKQGAAINCTQLSKKGERIGYTSSRQQETMVVDTKEWTKSEIIVLLSPEVKTLELMTYMYGSGTAWFDDVSIKAFAESKVKTPPMVTSYIDTVIKIVKEHSLYRDSINWKKFPQQVRSLATGMQTYKEARLVVNYIVNELHVHGDNHSSLMSPSQVKNFSVSDLMGMGRKVETEYLGDGIGYIVMPGFGSLNDSIRIAFATNAQQLIRKVDAENKICGWVVDLRFDNGGSCPPMIAGLGPILGDGIFDKNISKNNDTFYTYFRDGMIYDTEKGKIAGEPVIAVTNSYKIKTPDAPVAVLIGPRCGSSGECAVAAFIGRRDTKLFGKPTAGFTKGNEDFTLADGSMLFIAAVVQTDRNGKKYPDRIFPDIEVDEPANSKTDITLERAKQWLVSFGVCK